MTFPADTYSSIGDLSTDFAPPSRSVYDDADLIEAQQVLGRIRRRVDAAIAQNSAEIAHRSRRELGDAGLAQRLGSRTAERLVQHLTGGNAREARTAVRVGIMMNDAAIDGTALDASAVDATAVDGEAAATSAARWLAPLGAAVSCGELSIEAADVIRAGLGAPNDDVSADDLVLAAHTLLFEARGLNVEQLAVRARDLRAEIDLAHVADRERELRDKRFLRIFRQADGMTRLSGLLDPESAAVVVSIFDSATSPRRGGPRFVETGAAERADRISRDERTTEQLALDDFVQLLHVGATIDDTTLVGIGQPAVQVLVTERDLHAREGLGRIAGQSEPISIDTVERQICTVGIVPVLFDSRGQSVNVGRTQRLFNRAQRKALAARDGGCRFPHCERPASWTEAHHINEWQHGGLTDLADGILMCKHHHLLMHNNRWKVIRQGADYFVVPPPDLDPRQVPIPAPSKSVIMRRLVLAS